MSSFERPSDKALATERWPGEETDIEKEREQLRREIETLRDGADDLEKRLEEIARGRAEIGYAKRMNRKA